MPAQIDKIFSAISDYSRMMGELHIDHLILVRRGIELFEETSGNISSQMQWQCWGVVSLSALSATLAVAGSLIPKGPDSAALPLNNPRLGANDGIGDGISNALKFIDEKLKDSEFLRSSCKTASKFFGDLSEPAQIWSKSQTTQLESKKELIQTYFREGQGEKSGLNQEMKKAQESALSILQSKSRN